MGIISNMLKNAKDKEIAKMEFELQRQKMQQDQQMALIQLMQQGVIKPNNPEEYMRAKAGQYQETTMPGVGAIMVPQVQQQQQADPRQQIQALMQGLQQPATPNLNTGMQPRIKGITAKLGDNLSANIEIPETEAEMNTRIKRKAQEESMMGDVEVEKEAKKSFQEYISTIPKISVALEKVADASMKLGDFDRGIVGQLGAKVATAAGKMGKDKNIERYIIAVKQELIPLARTLGEEKGPISNTDVKSIEKSLGEITTPLSDKMFALGNFAQKVKTAIESKQQLAGVDLESFYEKHPEYEKINGTLNKLIELGGVAPAYSKLGGKTAGNNLSNEEINEILGL